MRRYGIIVALIMLVLVNAFVLGGVAYNRSGNSGTVLQLDERELSLLPGYFNRNRENTSLSFRLNWHDGQQVSQYLGESKLVELGFDREFLRSDKETLSRRIRHVRSRKGYAVLEFDGHAWQALLKIRKETARKAEVQFKKGELSEFLRDRDVKDPENFVRSASRLVAIDAGLDAAALRERYPDRKQYIIVNALFSPDYKILVSDRSGNPLRYSLSVDIDAILPDRIHVPREFHHVIDSLAAGDAEEKPYTGPLYYYRGYDTGRIPRYAVQLHYGHRLEPWPGQVELLTANGAD